MNVFKEIMSYVIIIVVVVLIRTFIVTPVKVDGPSMYPSLKNNDILLLKKYDKSYNRFDIISFKHGKDKLVKRIIALPGEKIKISVTHVGDNSVSKIYINGQLLEENYGYEPIKNAGIAANEITLGEDEYFVLGDNRNISSDSRYFGVIKKSDIKGISNFRLFPFNSFGKFN